MTWSVVVPSGNAENLRLCIMSILDGHPQIERDAIVVVADGVSRSECGHAVDGVTWIEGLRPFVFARNVNAGISARPSGHIVVLGDDGIVLTPTGFDRLEEQLRLSPKLGMVSAGIVGSVGNDRQQFRPGMEFVPEPDMLCFVCVMLRRELIDCVGLMDEAFVGYGCDDVDYSWRARDAGWELGTSERCLVRHDRTLPSEFRRNKSREAFERSAAANRELLRTKWPSRLIP